MALLDHYEPGDFFDEMFSGEGQIRPHYAALHERFQGLDKEEFDQRRAAVDAALNHTISMGNAETRCAL